MSLPIARSSIAWVTPPKDGCQTDHAGMARYLAEHIPNARYVETAGDDHFFFFRTQHQIVDAVEWVRSQEALEPEEDRFLSTVLVAHPQGEVDQDTWLAEVQRLRGQVVPGERLAYFDGPVRAMRCGLNLSDSTSASSVQSFTETPGRAPAVFCQRATARWSG